ncbi:TPA: hypothetical protein DEX28_01980 [Patescibacteria group bacterium]|nr:MAG: Enolase [Parcubacteria group bacterium GW2011_GWA1_Parcubacteria_45_10]KKT89280.1 MAG: Enolase [Parcubacteria group bacterium GW2011_GWB1_45_10]HCI05492.1 hypothetical protein [Patescibacteria group bacterium]
MAKIQKIQIQKALGFRSSETIRVAVFDDTGASSDAFVAFGKSEGKYEAKYLEPDQAVLKSGELTAILSGMDVFDQAGIDKKMIELDPSFQKEKLGGNVMLGVSFACAKLAAQSGKKQLFEHLAELFSAGGGFSYQSPKILFNIIEGGVHAKNHLPVQEHLLLAKEKSVKDQIESLDRFFDGLAKFFESEKKEVNYGDEGGFDIDFRSEKEVLDLLAQKISLGDRLGIDAAANNISGFEPEKYMKEYLEFQKNYPFSYFEDPFPEEGFNEYWQKLLSEIGNQSLIVGDDLTVTNPKKLKEVLGQKMINGIIIKPDQVGTLTETLETVQLARANGLKIVVSHRSQETNDDYLADLAVGVNADFVKFGAFYQGERLAKYNRLLEIESDFGFPEAP